MHLPCPERYVTKPHVIAAANVLLQHWKNPLHLYYNYHRQRSNPNGLTRWPKLIPKVTFTNAGELFSRMEWIFGVGVACYSKHGTFVNFDLYRTSIHGRQSLNKCAILDILSQVIQSNQISLATNFRTQQNSSQLQFISYWIKWDLPYQWDYLWPMSV